MGDASDTQDGSCSPTENHRILCGNEFLPTTERPIVRDEGHPQRKFKGFSRRKKAADGSRLVHGDGTAILNRQDLGRRGGPADCGYQARR